MDKGTLSSLNWVNRFINETPGDNQINGPPRQIPGVCWSKVSPTPTPNPLMRLWSFEMAECLGLTVKESDVLGGKKIVTGMNPYAQRYGGHQFGNWAGQLGDGRAITLGEVNTGQEILELQLKGSGMTPYSRFSDGKAVLRSSIREFLCSESMYHLGVPTTRALSLVTTGENVIRDILYNGKPAAEKGAIVCRVAPSFIRFGSFQIHSFSGDIQTLRSLVDYTVKHHFNTHNTQTDDDIIEWLRHVADETALMIAHWMRVGFVHGVMNTDNMSIHGLTIDYGPYGWIEDFNFDWTPNTTDSISKRYRFGNQAEIAGWNFARLLESISPLLETPRKLNQVLDFYFESYQKYSNDMWSEKLGLDEFIIGDDELIMELVRILQLVETDMTIFFRLLSSIKKPDISHLMNAFYSKEEIPESEWNIWLEKWWIRVKGNPNREKMNSSNPKYVLRNWMAQLAIDAAEKEDFTVALELHQMLKKPYSEQPEYEEKWFNKRPEWARHRVGCSMLSCSS